MAHEKPVENLQAILSEEEIRSLQLIEALREIRALDLASLLVHFDLEDKIQIFEHLDTESAAEVLFVVVDGKGAGPDEAHVAAQDVVELGEFVHIEFFQPAAHARAVLVALKGL